MLSIPLTVGWVIVVTNTMNIIDGLDGLAGGIAVIVAVTFFIIGIIEIRTKVILYILAALMGATIGFLKYNIHPASIFMGDTGSMLLGFVLASVSIMGYFKSVTLATLIVPVVALGVPIFDTIFAVIRRHRESAPIFKPDRKHLHHQFIDLGLTQKQTVFILYIISSFLGLSAVFLTYVEDTYALLILIFLGTLFSFGTKRIKWLKEKIDFEKEKMNEEKVIKNKIEENNAE
jgi:UDP-GlcNAc:undecaprenyl-phosphate GlcNAc-1-phosphate transferase